MESTQVSGENVNMLPREEKEESREHRTFFSSCRASAAVLRICVHKISSPSSSIVVVWLAKKVISVLSTFFRSQLDGFWLQYSVLLVILRVSQILQINIVEKWTGLNFPPKLFSP